MGNAVARALVNSLRCVAFQSEVVTTSAKKLAAPRGSVTAICKVEGQPLRFRLDGVAPTAATGMEAFPRDEIHVDGREDLENFQFIRHGDSDPHGKLVCHYYK